MVSNHFRGQDCVVTRAASGIGLAVFSTSIMGETLATEPPVDAIPADEAARIILTAQRREAFASGDAEAVFRTPRDRR